MQHTRWFKILPIIFLMAPAVLHAETEPKKYHSLEEMSSAELKEALRKSHAEIESRLGANTTELGSSENDFAAGNKTASLSEKRSYETSAQNRINMLDYKIRALEADQDKDWGYSRNDASKLKDIQADAREQLMKIRSDNTDGWKTNKHILDGLLRSASNY